MEIYVDKGINLLALEAEAKRVFLATIDDEKAFKVFRIFMKSMLFGILCSVMFTVFVWIFNERQIENIRRTAIIGFIIFFILEFVIGLLERRAISRGSRKRRYTLLAGCPDEVISTLRKSGYVTYGESFLLEAYENIDIIAKVQQTSNYEVLKVKAQLNSNLCDVLLSIDNKKYWLKNLTLNWTNSDDCKIYQNWHGLCLNLKKEG